jgi:hypothetical protein
MNRRNFFSLAALSLGAVFAGRRALEPTAALPAKRSILDFEPLDLGAYTPPGHTHSISDPTHIHSVNPNWIPARGQWVHIDGVGRFEVVA